MIMIVLFLIIAIFKIVKKMINLNSINSRYSIKLYFDNKRVTHILTVVFCELLWLLFSKNNILLLYVTISLAIIILFIFLSHTIYNNESNLLITYLGKKVKVNKVEFNNEKNIIRFVMENGAIEYTIYNKKRYNTIISQLSDR